MIRKLIEIEVSFKVVFKIKRINILLTSIWSESTIYGLAFNLESMDRSGTSLILLDRNKALIHV